MSLPSLSAAAVLALALLAGCDAAPTAHSGDKAPDLAVLDQDGHALKLGDLAGKVVLVNFWLAECGPCLVEMPELDAVYRDWRARGFEIVAVNMGQDAATVQGIRRKLTLAFPLLADPLKITTTRYQVEGAPTSFLIDQRGVVREKIVGPLSKAALERRLIGLPGGAAPWDPAKS
ncbi:MAG: redoxin domain-containing protein [Azospirillum sp.]|nr:redoxin domain-containing protein [Azospirillum sp.]